MKEKPPFRAELREPSIGNGWALHFFNVKVERQELYKLHYEINALLNTQVFLQGDHHDWMMFEFWTDDANAILEACEYMQDKLNIKIQ